MHAMLLLLSSISAAQETTQAPAATQVIVPELTAASVSDMSEGFLIYELLIQELSARGAAPIGAAELSTAVGDAAMDCADSTDCPGNLWGVFDAQIGLIGQVEGTELGLDVTVYFYEPGRDDPFKIVNETLGPGSEEDFVKDLADTTVALMVARNGFVPAGTEEPDPETDPETDPIPDPIPVSDPDPDGFVPEGSGPSLPSGTDSDPWSEKERKEMGISKGLYEKFISSGNPDPEDWLRQERVRTSKVNLEVGGGVSMGSVDRTVTVRLVLQQDQDDDFVELDRYEEDVLLGGVQGQGSLALYAGLSPRWDLGALVGLGYANKYLVTGWEQVDDGGLVDQTRSEPEPAAAAVPFVEPRLRFFPKATGVFKPYFMVHGNVRFYDSYALQDTEKVSYQPGRPGLQVIGVGGGLGFALDVTPEFVIFFEAPYTQFISGAEAFRQSSSMMVNEPEPNLHVDSVLRLTGGIGFKF